MINMFSLRDAIQGEGTFLADILFLFFGDTSLGPQVMGTVRELQVELRGSECCF